MDNYFEVFDIRVSKWGKLGQFLIFFDHLRKALANSKWLALVSAAGFILSCAFLYDVALMVIPSGYFAAAGSFVAASILFVLGCKLLADWYFRINKTDYTVCIRDSIIQVFCSLAVGFLFWLSGVIAAVIAIIVCNAALSLIYLKVLAKRKLP